MSLATSSSHIDDCEEDLWTTWGRIVNDWENYMKKKNPFVKVNRLTYYNKTQFLLRVIFHNSFKYVLGCS